MRAYGPTYYYYKNKDERKKIVLFKPKKPCAPRLPDPGETTSHRDVCYLVTYPPFMLKEDSEKTERAIFFQFVTDFFNDKTESYKLFSTKEKARSYALEDTSRIILTITLALKTVSLEDRLFELPFKLQSSDIQSAEFFGEAPIINPPLTKETGLVLGSSRLHG